mmetsp:Transcript_51485/g.112077  ORF Transcript_51485/g.112077 Transcript_51485/m.112077 type:complete len:85 (-) Transcript_51485:16-270(-)
MEGVSEDEGDLAVRYCRSSFGERRCRDCSALARALHAARIAASPPPLSSGKTPEEVRTRFNLKSDFTPEEEEEVRREYAWCEER